MSRSPEKEIITRMQGKKTHSAVHRQVARLLLHHVGVLVAEHGEGHGVVHELVRVCGSDSFGRVPAVTVYYAQTFFLHLKVNHHWAMFLFQVA